MKRLNNIYKAYQFTKNKQSKKTIYDLKPKDFKLMKSIKKSLSDLVPNIKYNFNNKNAEEALGNA